MVNEVENEYRKPYLILFNRLEDIKDAIEKGNYEKATALIILAHLDAEEEYISFGENDN